MSIIGRKVSVSIPLKVMDFYLGVGFDRGYIQPLEIREVLKEIIKVLQEEIEILRNIIFS